MRTVLRFIHGLGDCCQLTAIVRHIKKYKPEWEVTTQTPPGTQDLFRGLADHAEGLPYPWMWKHEKEIYMHWWRPQHEWFDLPSTKVTQCLLEGDFKTFDIPPDLDLYRYHCAVTDEQREAVEKWKAGRPPYICLHYQGVSCPDDKNLEADDFAPVVAKAKAMGWEVVVLDWTGKEHYTTSWQARGVQQFWLWDEKNRLNYSEAGTIKAIIEGAEMVVGIDSGVEHVAAATTTPTIVVWTGFHPYACFDPCQDANVVHCVNAYGYKLQPEAQKTFERLYRSREYLARWHLMEEQIPKLMETGFPEGDPRTWSHLDWQPA